MPLTVGGANSLATLWWFARANQVALFTGNPTVGAGTNEVTTTGYTRGTFGTNPWQYNEGTGVITNANLVQMGRIGAQSGDITHWGILDAAGVIILRGEFATHPGVLASNTALSFDPGDISLRVIFS